jgi:hypothetical protein
VFVQDLVRLAAPAESKKWLGEYSNSSLCVLLANGLATIAAFVGAIWMRQHVWWRLTLISLTLEWVLAIAFAWDSNVVQLLVPSGIRLDTVGIVLNSMPAAISLVAMLRDRQLGCRHDFYHWLGISTLWATSLLSWPSLYWYTSIYG